MKPRPSQPTPSSIWQLCALPYKQSITIICRGRNRFTVVAEVVLPTR
jgi:hypothetical protein